MLYFNIKYPLSYGQLILKYAREYDLDPQLIASIINVESRYDEKALSKKGAKGLMQITPSTGKWISEVLQDEDYREDRLFEPELNIRYGSWYIRKLLDEFDGDLDLALASYNAGMGNVRKWLANPDYSSDGTSLDKIPFLETENYLVRVEKNSRIYGLVYSSFKLEGRRRNYMVLLHGVKKVLGSI